MTQKTAVVTGAASGIGTAIVRTLAERGYRVIVTGRNRAACASLAEEVDGHALVLDVTDYAQSHSVADSVLETYGRMDVWVNNAGVSEMARFIDVTPEQFERTMHVNVTGVFNGGQAAARAMIKAAIGGRIINIGSMAGKRGGSAFFADYITSKFAVVGLTQAMAFELAPHGITVNAVCPAYVETPMQTREVDWAAELRGITREAMLQRFIDDTPLGRLEQPEDVARAVAFLASDDASFITGESLAVNGGAFMD